MSSMENMQIEVELISYTTTPPCRWMTGRETLWASTKGYRSEAQNSKHKKVQDREIQQSRSRSAMDLTGAVACKRSWNIMQLLDGTAISAARTSSNGNQLISNSDIPSFTVLFNTIWVELTRVSFWRIWLLAVLCQGIRILFDIGRIPDRSQQQSRSVWSFIQVRLLLTRCSQAYLLWNEA